MSAVLQKPIIKKIGMKNQLVLPQAICNTYDIQKNGFVSIEPQEDGVFIRAIADPITSSKGMFAHLMKKNSIEMKQEIREEEQQFE